ncbi:MAG: hypothetical protein IJ644_04315 [Oscillospiraceae bacterium]|nr:hypothetical protein [Oscillospiraceae bacterium]
MQIKNMLMLILLPALAGVLTACGGEQTETPYIPETAPVQKQTYPVLTTPAEAGNAVSDVSAEIAGDVEFVDAPETAPIIIDGDELPPEEPVSEIYQAAPDVMPDAETQ